ncbi:hypothetical protein STEG23_029400 [Scotinomys teguina]
MLLAVTALKLSLRLRCDFDVMYLDSKEFQSQYCRDFLYKTLQLLAKRSISCSRVTRGEQKEVVQALLNKLEIKKRQPFMEADYLSMPADCEQFKTKRNFIQFLLSKEEVDFPVVAYSMVVHEKMENFERLLRAVYTPQNIYYVHADQKSPDTSQMAVRAIASHFSNVFIASYCTYAVHLNYKNRIEDPDINPHRYEHLIFDKEAKTVKWKKQSIFNKWCWHYWMSTRKKLQIDPYLSPCTKLKSKWIKDLNINLVTLNLIEEKVGSTLECIGTGDHFLNITPTAQTLNATINQWDYMKLRSFCKAKDTVTKTKCQPTEWEKIFTNPTSDRGLISRIYKELKKQDIKTPNSPIKNGL